MSDNLQNKLTEIRNLCNDAERLMGFESIENETLQAICKCIPELLSLLGTIEIQREEKRKETISRLEDECSRLRKWVEELQSGMFVNCVYCGHRYGPEETTPVSMAEALKEHAESCPDHPMSALKAERDRLLEKVAAMEKMLERVCSGSDMPAA